MNLGLGQYSLRYMCYHFRFMFNSLLNIDNKQEPISAQEFAQLL